MQDIMLDLETLGTRPDAPICAIGAIAFDPKKLELGDTFYTVVDVCSNDTLPDMSTVLWWLNQSEEARAIFRPENQGVASPLEKALGLFTDFLVLQSAGKPVRIWGNGADFDNVVLAEAYRRSGLVVPWRYTNNRCYRTMKNMFPEVIKERLGGVTHNALEDAVFQADHLLAIMEKVYDVK